jgi:hypothetical protein
MLKFLPVLKIHAWGGLGSQLFAVSIAYDLFKSFPGRRIRIVLHTGGVTYRLPEVVTLFPGYEFGFRDDYRLDIAPQQSSEKPLNGQLRSFLKKISRILHLVETANDEFEFKRIKFWTLSLRGHYSYRTIPREFYLQLDKSIKELVTNHSTWLNYTCAIHYRLGDLLTLQEKKPLPVDLIMQELAKVKKENHLENFLIFSDSPDIALERLSPLGSELLNAPYKNSLEVIDNSVHAKYFVGTSSKISFWIAGLRASVYGLPSSLPVGNQREYGSLFVGVNKYVRGYPRNN